MAQETQAGHNNSVYSKKNNKRNYGVISTVQWKFHCRMENGPK